MGSTWARRRTCQSTRSTRRRLAASCSTEATNRDPGATSDLGHETAVDTRGLDEVKRKGPAPIGDVSVMPIRITDTSCVRFSVKKGQTASKGKEVGFSYGCSTRRCVQPGGIDRHTVEAPECPSSRRADSDREPGGPAPAGATSAASRSTCARGDAFACT